MRLVLRIGLWTLLLLAVAGIVLALLGVRGGGELLRSGKNEGWAGLGGLYLLVVAVAVGAWGIVTLTMAFAGLYMGRKRPEVLLPLLLLALVPTALLVMAALPFVLRSQRLGARHDATLARHRTEMQERAELLSSCLSSPVDPATRVKTAAALPLPDLDALVQKGAPGHRLATPRELACAFEALVPAPLRGPDSVLLAQGGDLDGDGKPDHVVAVTSRYQGALAFALVSDDGQVLVVEPEPGRSRVLLGLAVQEPPKAGGGPRFFDAQGPIAEQHGWPIDDPRFYPRTQLDDGRFQAGGGRTRFVAAPREVTALPELPL